jgi:hypothetical protein
MQWAVPFYDSEKNTIDFVAWNDASDQPCKVIVIVNDDKIIKFKELNKFAWSIITFGDISQDVL